VLIQGRTGGNNSKIIEIFRAQGSPGDGKSMHVNLEYNTFIGNGRSGSAKVVNLSNDTIDITTSLNNNIIVDTAFATHVDDPARSNWSITGSHNWVETGTNTDGLTNTSHGADAGFEKDFHLSSTSVALNTANSSPAAPKHELFLDQERHIFWRNRSTANDPGAFEHGNSAALVGPYGADVTAPRPPRNLRFN
jgi:hypothetical protein